MTVFKCSGCNRPLPDGVVECPVCGHRDLDRLRAVAGAAVDDELAQFDALVVTDDRVVSGFASGGEMPGCRVVAVDDSTAPLATADPLVPRAAAAGKRLLTWCIQRFGAELLVVDDDDYGTGYALDAGTGIWRAGGDTWTDWLATLAHELTAEVAGSGLTGRVLTSAVAQIQRLKRPGMVDQVRPMLRGMLRNIRRAGEPVHNVTECHVRDLNADTRYIGAVNGVVDLRGGNLLSPEQGRRHLVTLQVPVAFDPDADDPYVDRLFVHLGDDAARWWWRVLGFHLMGAPSRRFYVAVGPPAGGKSTLANALCGTLGPYAARPADDALEARPGGSAGLSPELEAFTLPRRWAVIDEAPRMKIAAPLLKRLSGDAE
ncbi:MAG: hypothetical protein OXK82_07970, partial [Deltaproteobacteria bacterium]|nr:hypothetical protein [Deltaproteobacteria bacterium]